MKFKKEGQFSQTLLISNASSINHSISFFQFAKTSHRMTINFVNVLYCFRKIAKRVHLLLCVWDCENLTSIKIPRSLVVFSQSSEILIFAISHKNYKLQFAKTLLHYLKLHWILIVILFSNVFANWYCQTTSWWFGKLILDLKTVWF